LGLSDILALWIAYILTRPLGASLCDLLSQPKADGGLCLGTVVTSEAFLVVLVGLVIFRLHRLNDLQRPAAAWKSPLGARPFQNYGLCR
jgi:uncharacterized membrane-anchored protein